MRYFIGLLALFVAFAVAAQDPCDPPLAASLSVFPTEVCSDGVVTVTFSLPPDDGDAFDVVFSVNGVTAQLSGILDGHTEQITITGTTVIRLEQVTNNDDDDDTCFTNFNTQITVTVSGIQVDFSPQNPTCDQNNGSITVTANGGTGPYQYSLDGGAAQNSPVFSGLGAGNYLLSVTDVAGCAGEIFATLTTGDAPFLSVLNQTAPGCGQNTGTITLTASGGTAPYQYSLNGGAFQNSASFGGLGAGVFTFTVRDAANCTAQITAELTSPGAPFLSVLNQTAPGCGQNTGAITLTASGGTAPYQYSLNGGAFQNSASFGGLGAGTYVCEVRDATNCTTSITAVLTDNSIGLPPASISATDTRGCSDMVFGLTANAPAGTTGTWMCSGCTIAQPSQPQLSLSGLPPGNTVVSWVLSTPNCPNYSSASVTITIFDPPVANTDGVFQVTVPNPVEVPVLINDAASATVFTEIMAPPQKGTVTFGQNQELLYQPFANAQGADTLVYRLCYDECPQVCDSAMVLFQIISENDPCFITGDTTNILTNGLTPNNDDINDKLVFRIVDVKECEVNYLLSDLIIYNRWGDVVYESKPYNNDWEGTNRDGTPLPPGVYYFVLRVYLEQPYSQFGNVIIIR